MQRYVKQMAVAAMVGLVAAATVARGAGLVNFAYSGNGGVATMGGGSGAQTPQRANDGDRERGTNAAGWTSNKVGGWWEVALPAYAAGGEVRQIRVFDRSCCSSIAPYDVKVYDGANVQLGATLSQASVVSQPWLWTYDLAPGLNGAARVRLEHTGVTAGDAYMGEVEVIGWNPYVGGMNTIGTDTLNSTITGATTAGSLNNARVVHIVLNETEADVRIDTAELRVFDTTNTDRASAANGGVTHARRGFFGGTDPLWQDGFGLVPSIVVDSSLNDGNLSSFSDKMASGSKYIGGFYGATLTANTTLDRVEVVNRAGCCGGQGDMKLQVFSDTARTQLIYDAPVYVNRGTGGETTVLGFQLGGVAEASMTAGETYRMEVSFASGQSDRVTVNPMQSSSTKLTVAGDLIVDILDGAPVGGESFVLFDADVIAGSFDSIVLPTLPGFYRWDTSALLTGGTLAVVAIPEPAGASLLLAAVAATALRRRR